MWRRDFVRITEERRLLYERLIGELKRELDAERRDHLSLLRELAGVKVDPVPEAVVDGAKLLQYRDLEPDVDRQATMTGERPAYAEPEPVWSPDGLSSSLDDDPLPELPPYQPADVDAYPEPMPEVEQRETWAGIAPGENPFKGLVGLDPDA